MYLVSLLRESCSLLDLGFSLPASFFFYIFFSGKFLEKLAFKLNSLRGAVFYCAGCTIIGVLLGMGVTAQNLLASESLSKIVAQLKVGGVLILTLKRSFFFFSLSAFPNCSYLIVRSMGILSTSSEKNTNDLRLQPCYKDKYLFSEDSMYQLLAYVFRQLI